MYLIKALCPIHQSFGSNMGSTLPPPIVGYEEGFYLISEQICFHFDSTLLDINKAWRFHLHFKDSSSIIPSGLENPQTTSRLEFLIKTGMSLKKSLDQSGLSGLKVKIPKSIKSIEKIESM